MIQEDIFAQLVEGGKTGFKGINGNIAFAIFIGDERVGSDIGANIIKDVTWFYIRLDPLDGFGFFFAGSRSGKTGEVIRCNLNL